MFLVEQLLSKSVLPVCLCRTVDEVDGFLQGHGCYTDANETLVLFDGDQPFTVRYGADARLRVPYNIGLDAKGHYSCCLDQVPHGVVTAWTRTKRPPMRVRRFDGGPFEYLRGWVFVVPGQPNVFKPLPVLEADDDNLSDHSVHALE